jgi:DNA (cytosine-5)-methyltransferase 1
VDVAINHDPEAVATHAANHPTTRHMTQNIYKVRPLDATLGRPVDILWASPDCKHFSKAKGGKPKKQNIRDLGWAVVHWARKAKPKLIFVENVEEFLTWGPLGRDNHPIKELAGETFNRWVAALEAEGYRVEWQLLRACDYGAPTIRRRLFIVARRDRKPIVWPEQLFGPGRAKPWRTAAECIDWSLPVPSIFDRKKPLAENTLRRIAEGLRRYVIEAREPFIVPGSDERASWILQANTGVIGRPTDWPLSTICQTGSHQQVAAASLVHYYGPRPGAKPRCGSVDEPFRTVTADGNRFGLAVATLAPFIQHVQHGGKGRAGVMPANEPLRTITAYPKGGCMALASATLAPFLVGAGGPSYGGKPTVLNRPLGTLINENHKALVATYLVQANHAGGFRGQSVLTPLSTISQRHGFGLATAYLSHFNKTFQEGSLVLPAKTVTAGGLHAGLVAAFLTKFFGSSTVESLSSPVSTLCRNDKLGLTCAFLTKYYGQGACNELLTPMGTVTTKDRFGLVLVQAAPLVWIGGEAYLIADIGLRMLTPRELARAQGFPDGYIIDPIYKGKRLTQKAQVAGIGNSVPPAFAEALTRANLDALDYQPPVRQRPAPLFEDYQPNAPIKNSAPRWAREAGRSKSA